jgi:hypothetical protein
MDETFQDIPPRKADVLWLDHFHIFFDIINYGLKFEWLNNLQ